MLRSFSAPPATMIASVGALVAATFIASLTVFLSGVLEVRAEPQAKVTVVRQAYAKGDRLPVLGKGAACSSLGWPHYEPSCKFDMRRPADDMRPVRIIALR
jgi:hypothetical protein